MNLDCEFDFFDLVELPFDPHEKAVKRVSSAIKKAKQELVFALSVESQQIARDNLLKKLDYLKSIESAFFSNEGKLTSVIAQLAERKIMTECAKLTSAAQLLKQAGCHTITSGTVRIHLRKTKLSRAHIEEVYRDEGFTISEIDTLAAYPKFPTNSEGLFMELDALSKLQDPNPNGADLRMIKDLYFFVAYLNGELENAAEYRNMTTSELEKLLKSAARGLTVRNDSFGIRCCSLATSARIYVFNTDKNRAAYDIYLKYKSSELQSLFSALKDVPPNFLYLPQFADNCIRGIMAVHFDYYVALAIYNKEAGLRDAPYIPEKELVKEGN